MSGVKTFSNETSERYALALYELASENSEIDEIEKNVNFLLEVCNQNSDFTDFLKNPTYQFDVQAKIFSEISKVMSNTYTD